jgi:hypothetical protein
LSQSVAMRSASALRSARSSAACRRTAACPPPLCDRAPCGRPPPPRPTCWRPRDRRLRAGSPQGARAGVPAPRARPSGHRRGRRARAARRSGAAWHRLHRVRCSAPCAAPARRGIVLERTVHIGERHQRLGEPGCRPTRRLSAEIACWLSPAASCARASASIARGSFGCAEATLLRHLQRLRCLPLRRWCWTIARLAARPRRAMPPRRARARRSTSAGGAPVRAASRPASARPRRSSGCDRRPP